MRARVVARTHAIQAAACDLAWLQVLGSSVCQLPLLLSNCDGNRHGLRDSAQPVLALLPGAKHDHEAGGAAISHTFDLDVLVQRACCRTQ